MGYFSKCSPCVSGQHHGDLGEIVWGYQTGDDGYPWRVVCDCECQGHNKPSLHSKGRVHWTPGARPEVRT